MSFWTQLSEVVATLDAALQEHNDEIVEELVQRLKSSATDVGKSWSGSWLGYQSRIYYDGFQVPPPGARFSQDWGLKKVAFVQETLGDWVEYRHDDVMQTIYARAGNPDIEPLRERAMTLWEVVDSARNEMRSVLSLINDTHGDQVIAEILDSVKKIVAVDASDILRGSAPRGPFRSRDYVALEQGIQAPPHLVVLADVHALRHPTESGRRLSQLGKRAKSHLENRERLNTYKRQSTKNMIFIGHGRSRVWKDLKDFLQDRLHLSWEEFNRVPTAGVSTVARLSEMLDNVAFAFIVMTAEDEHADGEMFARLNVVHEAGLFQGKLGFGKAIILLEDGCKEFSNIIGLGQIRFPKGDIAAKYEEIRRVLEREGVIEP